MCNILNSKLKSPGPAYALPLQSRNSGKPSSTIKYLILFFITTMSFVFRLRFPVVDMNTYSSCKKKSDVMQRADY